MHKLLSTVSLALLLSAANAQSGEEAPFNLMMQVPEPRITNGELQTEIIAKRFELPHELIERSRSIGRLSTLLDSHFEDIFARLDARQPQNAAFRQEGGQWVARQQSGWKVNREATKANLWEAIQAGRHEADIRVNLTAPARTVTDLANAGILHHFGGGESSFKGSPGFREQNIMAGASIIGGQYILPGAEFDFNNTIGEISQANGFVPGYIIAGNTLEKEVGGGICQVSTTLFRAAYEAGLPITQRNQHSYHVHYYDPVGYEATVYAPYKNLKFVNDTNTPLLIQTSWDLSKQTLRFDFFGPRPDRTVSISDPQVSNVKPPAAPTFMADPSVPRGEERLIDGPEQGLTAVIERRVEYDTGEVKTDSIRSVYVPWGGVYAVNPSDPRAN